MANFILSYDLNGPGPSHVEMDDHLRRLGQAAVVDRVLETVWYVRVQASTVQLRDYVRRILGPEDLLLVVATESAAWTKLLVDDAAFKAAFESA